ncbi:MAG: hypothetical protein ACT4NV_03175 [Rhodoferax sp.]
MAKGRKPSQIDNPSHAVAEEQMPGLPAAVKATDIVAAVQADYNEERDLVNQLLGQVQMARSFARFADVVSLSKLKHIKESKLYRALAGKKGYDPDGNEIADVGTFDGFCQALGLSRSKVDEDLTNLAAFGEEALKQLSAIGAGYRELRQFRRLPEDQKTALIEVAKTGDKDSFLELAEDLIAKHAKEKEVLAKQVDEITADKDAKERHLADKEATINRLQRDVVRLSKPLAVTPWDTRVAPFQKEITERQSLLDAAIGQHKKAVEALDAWLTDEVTSQPDYDPEATVVMPHAVRAVLLHLDDAVTRTAALVAGLQHELRLRFGADIDDARQHLLAEGA